MYTPNRRVPVIVQNRDALEAIVGLLQATGSVVFAANATDTKVLEAYGETFEFLEDLADLGVGNIGVQIGQDAEETRDSFLAALADLPPVNPDVALVAAEATTVDGDPGVALTYWEVGTVGNSVITTNDVNVDVAGMSGGTDGGLVRVQVAGFEAPDIDIGDVNILNADGEKIDPAEQGEADAAADLIITALDAPAQQGGVGAPQANLATDGAGAWATVAIPAGTNFIDFLVDVAAYVCATAFATTPFGTNNGVPYQPNLNFRLPCQGATNLHLKGTGAAVHTLKWNAIA